MSDIESAGAQLDERANNNSKMYGDLAWTFPILSPAAHYLEEAERIRRLILEKTSTSPREILDLGCGAGNIDFHLKKSFTVTAVDCSGEMLKLARNQNPEVTHIEADMRNVKLGRKFGAAICLDAILYMTSLEDLRAVLRTAYAHLRAGGVFIAYPQETRESFQQNKTRVQHHAGGGADIMLIENLYDIDPDDTEYTANYIYLIRRDGKQEIHHDIQHIGLFSKDMWRSAFEETGFQTEMISLEPGAPPSGLPDPVFIGVRPSTAGQ